MRDVLPGSPEGVTAPAIEAVVSAVASHVDCANDTSSSAVDAAKARVSMAPHEGNTWTNLAESVTVTSFRVARTGCGSGEKELSSICSGACTRIQLQEVERGR